MSDFDAVWRERFERFGRIYADEAEISGWSDLGLRRRVAIFSSLLPGLALPPEAAVLDLGCGGGTYVRLLAGLGHRAVGLDYSLPSLARAVDADPGLKGRYVAGGAYALPFAEGAFDLVVSIGVLQAIDSPERALDEMIRVLTPGGTLVVEALNDRAVLTRARTLGERLRGVPARVRAYASREVRAWLSARGLRLVRQAGIFLPPRQLPGLIRLVDLRAVSRALETRPALAEAAAHSFLFVARRRPAHARGDS